MLLNTRFLNLAEEKLGTHAIPRYVGQRVLAHAEAGFETLKRSFPFEFDLDQTYTVPVPGMANNAARGIRGGRWEVAATDLKEVVFGPVVNNVVASVQKQIHVSGVPIRAVLLVGGFGRSEYLRDALKRETGDINIVQLEPEDAWTAVIRGGLMKGLAMDVQGLPFVQIAERRARNWYGIKVPVDYIPKQHGLTRLDAFWDARDLTFKLWGIKWFISRGDQVRENQPFTTTAFRAFPVSKGLPRFFDIEVYRYGSSHNVPQLLDENVIRIAQLRVDLSQIAEAQVGKAKGKDDCWYYLLLVELQMVFNNSFAEYTVIYKGQKVSMLRAAYEG
jgi:hypothetical protein